MKSMTGFGKAVAQDDSGGTLTVELSSVNRKQLEIRFQMPSDFFQLENFLRKKIAGGISRGMINCRISYEAPAGTDLNVDEAKLERMAQAALATLRKLGLPEQLDGATLLTIPGVVKHSQIDAESLDIQTALGQAIDRALEAFDAMRQNEGAELKTELAGRLESLKLLHSQLAVHSSAIVEDNRKRLLEKLANDQLPCDPNDERFQRELLFYLDKSDVTEELTRLESHFGQLAKFLAGDEPAGRSMDFLLQEMFREINTLGNKAGKVNVSDKVVTFKTELEKMREQIQNIE